MCKKINAIINAIEKSNRLTALIIRQVDCGVLHIVDRLTRSGGYLLAKFPRQSSSSFMAQLSEKNGEFLNQRYFVWGHSAKGSLSLIGSQPWAFQLMKDEACTLLVTSRVSQRVTRNANLPFFANKTLFY